MPQQLECSENPTRDLLPHLVHVPSLPHLASSDLTLTPCDPLPALLWPPNTPFLSHSHSLSYSSYLSSKIPKSILGQITPLSSRQVPSCLLQSLPGDPQPAQKQLIIQPSYTQVFSQTRSSIYFPQTQSVGGYLGNTASGSLPRALGPFTEPLLMLSSALLGALLFSRSSYIYLSF